MQKIVGVRRLHDKDTYFFLQNNLELKLEDKVVVSFDEFETVASVVKLGLTEQDDKAAELRRITRLATESDLARFEALAKKAKSKLPEIKRKSLDLGLMMKFVSAEYSLDESKILITFSSEERVDFRQLLKDLASSLKVRIELRQIGQRDEIKVCGGVGPCGQQCCCARFLKNFEHVTVKMAKVQSLSLSPTKINGICGRLMCCLGYEAEMYEKMLEKMPKVGSTLKGPNGEGVVVYNDILRERVSIKRQADGDTFVVEDFPLEQITNPEEYRKKQQELEAERQSEKLDDARPEKPAERPQGKDKFAGNSDKFASKSKNDAPRSDEKHGGFSNGNGGSQHKSVSENAQRNSNNENQHKSGAENSQYKASAANQHKSNPDSAQRKPQTKPGLEIAFESEEVTIPAQSGDSSGTPSGSGKSKHGRRHFGYGHKKNTQFRQNNKK